MRPYLPSFSPPLSILLLTLAIIFPTACNRAEESDQPLTLERIVAHQQARKTFQGKGLLLQVGNEDKAVIYHFYLRPPKEFHLVNYSARDADDPEKIAEYILSNGTTIWNAESFPGDPLEFFSKPLEEGNMYAEMTSWFQLEIADITEHFTHEITSAPTDAWAPNAHWQLVLTPKKIAAGDAIQRVTVFLNEQLDTAAFAVVDSNDEQRFTITEAQYDLPLEDSLFSR